MIRSGSAFLRRCLWLLGLVNLGFCLHAVIHQEPATIALLGASLFMLMGHARGPQPDMEELSYLTEVEWKTIFFFIGLFILVGGLVKVGAIRMVADQLVSATQGNQSGAVMAVLWGSALLSAAVDNIPYVAAMNPSSSIWPGHSILKSQIIRRSCINPTFCRCGGPWPSGPVWVETAP